MDARDASVSLAAGERRVGDYEPWSRRRCRPALTAGNHPAGATPAIAARCRGVAASRPAVFETVCPSGRRTGAATDDDFRHGHAVGARLRRHAARSSKPVTMPSAARLEDDGRDIFWSAVVIAQAGRGEELRRGAAVPAAAAQPSVVSAISERRGRREAHRLGGRVPQAAPARPPSSGSSSSLVDEARDRHDLVVAFEVDQA